MSKNSDNFKFTNVRFDKTNAFDTKALTILDNLRKASGKSQTYIIKELLIRYGSAAMNTAVFDLNETGLGAAPLSQPAPSRGKDTHLTTMDSGLFDG